MSEEKQPKIRFKGFDDPWEQRKLGEIFNIIDGDRGHNYPHESNFLESGNVLFLDTGNVKKNGFNFETQKYISDQKDKQLKNGKLNVGDFVLTSRGTLGNVAYYDKSISQKFPEIRINSAMLILRKESSQHLSNLFLESSLRGKIIDNFMRNDHVGSAQPHITKKDFSKVKLNIPQLWMEQDKVGKIFQNIFILIAANQSKLEQLKRLKKLLMQKIFNQEWRFKGFTDPWEQRKLGEGLKQLKSYSLPRKYEVPESDTEYIHYGDIHTSSRKYVDKSFRLPNIKSGDFQLLQTGDIVLADASEDYKEIAEPMLMKNIKGRKVVSGLHTIAIRLKCGDPVYYLYLFLSPGFRHYVYKVGTGLKVFGINYDKVQKYFLAVPDEKEQKYIGKILFLTDQLIAANQRRLDHLQSLKKYLMQNMFV